MFFERFIRWIGYNKIGGFFGEPAEPLHGVSAGEKNVWKHPYGHTNHAAIIHESSIDATTYGDLREIPVTIRGRRRLLTALASPATGSSPVPRRAGSAKPGTRPPASSRTSSAHRTSPT